MKKVVFAFILAAIVSGCAKPEPKVPVVSQQPQVARVIYTEKDSPLDYTIRAEQAVIEGGRTAKQAASQAYDWAAKEAEELADKARRAKKAAKEKIHEMTE